MNKLAPGIVAGTATLALGLTALSPAVASPASDSKRDVRDSASAKHQPDISTDQEAGPPEGEGPRDGRERLGPGQDPP